MSYNKMYYIKVMERKCLFWQLFSESAFNSHIKKILKTLVYFHFFLCIIISFHSIILKRIPISFFVLLQFAKYNATKKKQIYDLYNVIVQFSLILLYIVYIVALLHKKRINLKKLNSLII